MRASIGFLAVLALARPAGAEEQAAPHTFTTTTSGGTKASLTVGGYVHVFYGWNFNEPSNGITNYRGFDNRHNSFTIENAALDVAGGFGPVSAHLVLQTGHAAESVALAEPLSVGTNVAATTDGPNVWKLLQEANVAYVAPLGRGLTIDGGIFLSPIGPEFLPIKSDWNFSRSDLFFGLPYYHTGFRLGYPFTSRLTAQLAVYNGWNSVVDNNAEKSIAALVSYNVPDRLSFNLVYFTGVERPTGAPEGRAWRHLFDAYAYVYPRRWLALLAQLDGGFEPNAFGTSGWLAGALYVRFHPLSWLYIALRGDYFREWIAENGTGQAAPLFWGGARFVAEGTGTLDFRPWDTVSFRVEYRYDRAERDLYFDHQVMTDLLGRFIANAPSQQTLTLGAVAWF